jgi:hypothetical protein
MNAGTLDRLADVSTAALSRAQKGLREVLAQYEAGEAKGTCPLCRVTTKEHECPWWIFAGKDCMESTVEWACRNGVAVPDGVFAIVHLKESMDPRWVKHRKRQIKSWMRQISYEIESR